MPYAILFTEPFEADVIRLFDWLFGFNAVAAFRFRDAVDEATASLSDFPNSSPVADENDLYVRTVRRKVFKSGATTYRLLFTVYEAGDLGADAEPSVRCLRVLHGAARPLKPEN